MEGQVRTMASALYAPMGVRIHPGHAVMTGLTRYAAVVLNRRTVVNDGNIAQERISEMRSLRAVCVCMVNVSCSEFQEHETWWSKQSGSRPWRGVVGQSEEACWYPSPPALPSPAALSRPDNHHTLRSRENASQMSGTVWRLAHFWIPEEPHTPPILQPIPQEQTPDINQNPEAPISTRHR